MNGKITTGSGIKQIINVRSLSFFPYGGGLGNYHSL